jgi:hypothetical protein
MSTMNKTDSENRQRIQYLLLTLLLAVNFWSDHKKIDADLFINYLPSNLIYIFSPKQWIITIDPSGKKHSSHYQKDKSLRMRNSPYL